MGCHTWFYRPLTNKEFETMKEEAPKEIEELLGADRYLEDELTSLHDVLMKSYNENLPCAYGKYWWQLGWGGGELYPVEIRGEHGLFAQVRQFNDTFRVKNYPLKVIHNRRELRRWMRKRYFTLTDEQLNEVSLFFKEYPGGVICFG